MFGYLQQHQIVELAVKATGKWTVYIHNSLEYKSEEDAAVWEQVKANVAKMQLSETESRDLLVSIIHGGLINFNDPDSALKFFQIFNEGAVYGSAIFAALLNPSGEWLTENT